MKYMILILLLWSIPVQAERSLELISGGLTYHIIADEASCQEFQQKVSDSGRLIYTPLYGLAYTRFDLVSYDSFKGFFGKNSVGGDIEGVVYSLGLRIYNFQFGAVGGTYYQDDQIFRDHGVDPQSIDGFMPILGFELNYSVLIGESNFIKMNNLFTPVITNHTISVGRYF